MAYGALTAFLEVGEIPPDLDEWAHSEWVVFLAFRHGWTGRLTDEVKRDIIMLMDAAAERARKQEIERAKNVQVD
jgi:hypothetical protein